MAGAWSQSRIKGAGPPFGITAYTLTLTLKVGVVHVRLRVGQRQRQPPVGMQVVRVTLAAPLRWLARQLRPLLRQQVQRSLTYGR